MPGARTLDYRIDVDASGGVRGLKQFSSAAKAELRTVDNELGEVESAGDRVARVISDMAGKIDRDLRDAAAAADALRTALGPELTSRTNVDALVLDLQRMGLTFDDIKGSADKLAVSIKEVDQVSLTHVNSQLDDTHGKIRNVGTESDQTRSVMANMVGNAAQDMGDLAGAAGTAGVAIGQLGEYAADGNISLSGLTKLAGPMAALGLATQAVGTYMAGVKLQKEFDAKRVEQFTDAFKELKTAAQSVNEQFEETGKIEVIKSGGFLGLGKSVQDITPDLAELNINLDKFNEIVAGSADSWDELLVAIQGTGTNMFNATQATVDVALAVQQHRKEIDKARKATDDYNEVAGNTTGILGPFGKAMDAIKGAAKRTEGQFDDTRTSTERFADEMERLDEQYANLTARFDDEAALLNVKDGFDDLKDAMHEAWDATNTGAADAKDKTRDARQETLELTRQVRDYLAEVLKLPPSKVTEILTMIDNGSVVEAEREIDRLTKERDLFINAIVRGNTRYGGVSHPGYGPGGSPVMVTVPPNLGAQIGAQIAAQIGTVRVPVDAYTRSTPRTLGFRL
jgi:hypothetical protein